MKIIRQCRTCKFNFSGTCACGDNDTHKYGDEIKNDNDCCEGWNVSFEYFTEITSNLPWYARESYLEGKISFSAVIDMLEADARGEAVEVNIFDVIKKIYDLSLVDLAIILNVSFGVMHRARRLGVPQKRIKKFSETLCIPIELFDKSTTADFDKIEKCKIEFYDKLENGAFEKNIPDWKKDLDIDVSNILRCPIHISRDIAFIDKLYWQTNNNELNSNEQLLIDFLSKQAKKENRELVKVEYYLDLSTGIHLNFGMKNIE